MIKNNARQRWVREKSKTFRFQITQAQTISVFNFTKIVLSVSALLCFGLAPSAQSAGPPDAGPPGSVLQDELGNLGFDITPPNGNMPAMLGTDPNAPDIPDYLHGVQAPLCTADLPGSPVGNTSADSSDPANTAKVNLDKPTFDIEGSYGIDLSARLYTTTLHELIHVWLLEYYFGGDGLKDKCGTRPGDADPTGQMEYDDCKMMYDSCRDCHHGVKVNGKTSPCIEAQAYARTAKALCDKICRLEMMVPKPGKKIKALKAQYKRQAKKANARNKLCITASGPSKCNCSLDAPPGTPALPMPTNCIC